MQARREARVRILHTSPDMPPVDIYFDESPTPAITNLAYSQISAYFSLSPERHHIAGFLTGGTVKDDVIDNPLQKLQAGQDYTVIAVGMLKDVGLILMEDIVPTPSRKRAKMRVLHASPNAPALDVDLTGNPALLRQLAFTDTSNFLEVDAGTVNLTLRRANHDETLATLTHYPLVGATLYTFVALGLVGGQPAFTILPLVRTSERCPIPQ